MTTRHNQHKARPAETVYAPGNGPSVAELELARRQRKARVRLHRRKAKSR